jgi:hypothetical protein
MRTVSTELLREVASAFDLRGDFRSGEPYGSGHINDTFRVRVDQAGVAVSYILQRVNTRIFRDGRGLMENVARVTAHARRRLEADGANDVTRRTLTLVPARDASPSHTDREGGLWRAYFFIDGARTYDLIRDPAQAREAARAFGAFQRLLADLGGPRLHETIPHFHDTPRRLEALRAAVRADAAGRAAAVSAEIDFALARAEACGRLVRLQAAGEIPERVTHNDTKLNNVMIDDATGEGVCVIDLDTVMPGLALYDFGDMVRSATNSAEEDDPDPSHVRCRREIFEALARGYLEAADFLVPAERSNLVFGGLLMTLECGIRFLTDYLQGDVYFRTKRPGHNLDRCRNQFALVRSIEAQQEELRRIVDTADGAA